MKQRHVPTPSHVDWKLVRRKPRRGTLAALIVGIFLDTQSTR